MKGKGVTPLWVLGLMSGTSLDGVDGAMVLTDGVQVLEFGPHAYRAYTDKERATIRAAFGQWPGDAGVAAAAQVVEDANIEFRFDNFNSRNIKRHRIFYLKIGKRFFEKPFELFQLNHFIFNNQHSHFGNIISKNLCT